VTSVPRAEYVRHRGWHRTRARARPPLIPEGLAALRCEEARHPGDHSRTGASPAPLTRRVHICHSRRAPWAACGIMSWVTGMCDIDSEVRHQRGRAVDLPPGVRMVPAVQYDTTNAADFWGVNRPRSYRCVVAGSAWPTVRCPSISLALVDNAVAMHVTRIGWSETPCLSPKCLTHFFDTRSMRSGTTVDGSVVDLGPRALAAGVVQLGGEVWRSLQVGRHT
jgi:hypothetical protein